PDDTFVARHFKSLGLFAHEGAGEIVADNRVPVGQTLASGGQSQRISRRLVFAELPDNFQVGIKFDDLPGSSERDEQMSVRQLDRSVRKTVHRNFTEQRAGGREL